MSRERRLGRGLEALLGRPVDEVGSPSQEASPAGGGGPPTVATELIDRNPYQPRTSFDEAEIADLCDSIRTHGFLQPIVVRPVGERYEVIAGERRLRAAQMGGFEEIPVQIREVDDRQMAELAIVENIQRKDLNAIEKGASFQRYLDQYKCTQEELARRVNIDRSTIANLIRLLDLPDSVKQLLISGAISAGHARALLPLGDPNEQLDFAQGIIKNGLSVRATERGVQDRIRQLDEPLSVVDVDGNTRTAPIQPGQHLRELEERFKMALGTRVDLRQTTRGKGRITIHFGDHDEFERLRSLLIGDPAGKTDVG